MKILRHVMPTPGLVRVKNKNYLYIHETGTVFLQLLEDLLKAGIPDWKSKSNTTPKTCP